MSTGVVAPATAPPTLVATSAMVTIKPVATVLAEEKALAERENATPLVAELAAHIRDEWQRMRDFRAAEAEPRMMRGLRQRRGEYDPQVLAQIHQQGGTEVYMRLSANKARAAASWIRDTLSATDGPLPYTLDPTPDPELPPERIELEYAKFMEELQQAAAAGVEPSPMDMDGLIHAREGMIENNLRDEAFRRAEAMKRKMDDQLVEGGVAQEFHKFVDDLVTFPFAVMKGPIVEKRVQFSWDANGELVLGDRLVPVWKRVSPLDIYWQPHMESVEDGAIIERHRLSRAALFALIGAPGYKESAVRGALDDYGRGGLKEWLALDSERYSAEGKGGLTALVDSGGLIDALQFWGSVSGQVLQDWGVPPEDAPDPDKDYPIEAWLVGRWVIKAIVNPDPLGRKPYYKTSYGEIPGTWLGESPMDLVRDCQDVCNGAVRAMVNNMGIASGPQVYVDIAQLPVGEELGALFPWKIHQFRSDGGSSAPPIGFFQPNSMAQELLHVYQQVSVLADEYSGIPRYMTGDGAAAGAGRTATGMSMMMNNAGKTIKQVIANIDRNVIAPLVERLWFWNMQYSTDPELKGDVAVNARGANSLVIKDAAAVRRNELLQLALSSPVAQQIIGEEGVAYMLREQAKTLDLNADKIVPPAEVVRAKAAVAQAVQAAMARNMPQPMPQGAAPPGGQPMPPGAQPMPGGAPAGETLMDGATPVADNFSPQPS